jgi:hypothetical protein
MDFLVSNNGEDAQLFKNDGGESPEAKRNHWLGVRLVGTKSNRDGIGAKLKVTAGDFVSYDQAKGGMSYCSAQDPRIYFGLGKHGQVDAVEISWLSGTRDVIRDLAADEIVTIEEGKGLTAYRYPPVRRAP